MKGSLKGLLVASALSVCSWSANAVVVDFESYAVSNVASIVDADFTLTSNSATFDITSSAPWGGNSLINYFNGGNTFTVAFNSLIDFFSIDVGDYNQDEDNVSLQLFDSSWNLLGSDSATNPASSSTALTLSVSAANAAYAVFSDADPFPGAVYWDNMTYEKSSVPEPSGLLLLGIGMLGFALMRRNAARS